MSYQIVYPYNVPIYGDSLMEAIKNYVKINDKINFTNLIAKDQANSYEAKLRYYMQGTIPKVGIDVYPYTNVIPQPIAIVPPLNMRFPLPINPVGGVTINPYGPVAINTTGPLVKAKNSRYMANGNTIFINHPFA
jgi:hypothetical protein